MKRWLTPTALCLAGSFALVSAVRAQDPSSSQNPGTTTTNTEVTDDGMTRTTKSTTVEGKVVRYEPGKTIVVVGPDSREVTYTLSSSVVAPADVQVGRVVTLSTQPAASGSGPVTVTRITTRSMNPDGSMKTETQTRTQSSSGDQTTMTKSTSQSGATTVTGTVSAYEPGRSVTFLMPDKTTVVYTVDTNSQLPSDLAVGKTYSVETTRTSTSGPLVVKRITTTTTTQKKTSVQ